MLKIGKPSFLGRKPPALVFSAFGKLPIYPDFLRFRCEDPAQRAFPNWLEQSFRLAEVNPKNPGRLGSMRCFLLGLPGIRDSIVGVIRDSADQNRRRAFPFTCFATLSAGALPEAWSDKVATLIPIWAALARADAVLQGCTEYAQFETECRRFSLEFPSPAEAKSLSTTRPLADFARNLGPDGESLQLGALLWRVKSALSAVRDLDVANELLPGIWLPIPREFDGPETAASWLRLLESNGLKPRHKTPFSLVVTMGAQGGAFWIYPRPVDPKDFGHLCAPAPSQLSYDPYEGLPDRDAGMEEFLLRVAAQLGPDRTSVGDLIQWTL